MSENNNTQETISVPRELPLFLTDDLVIFPGIITPLVVKEDEQIQMVNDVLAGNIKMLAIVISKPGSDRKERSREPSEVGCAVTIVKMLRIPDGTLRLLVQGIVRIHIDETFRNADNKMIARISELKIKQRKSLQVEAITRTLRDEFSEVIDNAPYLPYEMKVALVNISGAGELGDFVAANLNISTDERQGILAETDVQARLMKISRLVSRELQLLKLGNKIQTEVTGTIEKNQREYFLREQMKAIRRELGEDEESAEFRELKERVNRLEAPEQVVETAQKELERLERISPSSAEYTVVRTYLDWLIEIPWEVATEDRIDIPEARKILDDDHYGLNDVKERILEFLAIKKLKGAGRGSIICFVGPPGVGKTSIGRSIAKAMGRKFERMSLGGLRDEAEIRGHRRTYIGALPGRIVQGIKRAGSINPVFMLDEIDKLGSDFRGDPSSAMLEVLDPEQNFSFKDNYLEVDIDLSKVMFITTANYLETIPPPLRDRMEIIKLPGYVTPEKVQIARHFLVPRQIVENGLKANQITFSDTALEKIAVHFTREAGVRTLERTIGKVCRKVAVEIVEKKKKRVSITVKNYHDYLGASRIMPLLYNRQPQIGIANGLAWTQVGGVMLFIEAIAMPGQGKIKITGQLGDVMKESAEIAMSYIRNKADRFEIEKDFFNTHDFHIHIPEGATPKDGPSAGITLTAAMVSLFTDRPIRHDVAMTGEITLQGKVLPIGGLREKSVAAARGRMKSVVCPAANEADLEEIPQIIKDKLEFKFVDTIDEMLSIVLLPKKSAGKKMIRIKSAV